MENNKGVEYIMKLRRTFSGLLFGVGCAMTFVGLLSLILPAVPNDQLQLVLASFALPSENAMVNIINTCMSFAIENGWQVLIGGALMLTIGVVFFSRYTVEEAPPPRREIYRRPVQQTEPLWETPEPARSGPNPFADLALWEQYAPKAQAVQPRDVPKVGFVSPMLEPNRIEEETPVDTANIYARPAPQPEPEVIPVSPPRPEPEPIPEPVPEAPALDLVEAEAAPADEQPETPPQSGTPVQLSPRIRSTIGKRREW